MGIVGTAVIRPVASIDTVRYSSEKVVIGVV